MPWALSETPRKMLPPPTTDRDLDAQGVDLADLPGQVVGEGAVDAEGLLAQQRLAGELEQDALVDGSAGHLAASAWRVGRRASSPRCYSEADCGRRGSVGSRRRRRDLLAHLEAGEAAHHDVLLDERDLLLDELADRQLGRP